MRASIVESVLRHRSIVVACRNSVNLNWSTWKRLPSPCRSTPESGTVQREITTSATPQMKIYTKGGDKGTTALFTNERRYKNDRIFEAIGTTDELTAHIGLCREFAKESGHLYEDKLYIIQCILQDVMSLIATPKSSARPAHTEKVKFSPKHVTQLEEWIDQYTEELPALTKFILPGGGKASAQIHVTRSVCRRAERMVTPLVVEGEVNEQAQIYLNRLSDFLFTLARYAAKLDKREETFKSDIKTEE